MSRYFTRAEQACKCGCGGVLEPVFADWLDVLRDRLGIALTLTSAYRCAEHDAKVGGKGPHTTGRAADVAAIAPADKHELVRLALARGAQGVGVGATFVHVDVIAPGGKYPRPAIWTYPTRG